MALDKQALKAGIISLQQEMLTKTEAGIEEYAERLASLIEAYVKSGEVIVQTGIPVLAGTYTGVTTGIGKGTIN